MKSFREFGIDVPEILLPKDADISTWSVIACDQYTQDESYWDSVKRAVGSKDSTLNLILPEIYLNSPDRDERVGRIRAAMKDYLARGVFAPAAREFIYVERTTAFGRTRKGLVAALDLETYEWKPFSSALTRATEATIVERIPPRKEIRRGAPLEIPHIMLLVNDPDHSLIEACGARVRNGVPAYEGNLMLGAGSIKGWAVRDERDLDFLHDALSAISKKNAQDDGSVFLFAVGDGNHSLATAKAVWDEHKASTGLTESPVRYALVELVNIYDEGLTFEPIHRVLFGTDGARLLEFLRSDLGGTVRQCGAEEMEASVRNSRASFGFVYKGLSGRTEHAVLETDITDLAVSRLQPALDDFIRSESSGSDSVEIDYIHGSDEVLRLGGKDGAVSVMLPPVAKDSFFATISARGPLPRKSFSMGEASEKRFYLECRALFS